MRFQTAEAAPHIPELLEADVCGEPAFSGNVVSHLQGDAVLNDGVLAYCDISEGSSMHEYRLILHCGAQRRIDGVAHESRHGAAHLEVAGGDGLPSLIVGYGYLVHPFP